MQGKFVNRNGLEHTIKLLEEAKSMGIDTKIDIIEFLRTIKCINLPGFNIGFPYIGYTSLKYIFDSIQMTRRD